MPYQGVEPTRLVETLNRFGLRLNPLGSSFVFECPLCGKEKLYIRRSDGFFSCWVCRESHNFYGAPEFAIAKMTGAPLKEIQTSLYGTVPLAPGESMAALFEDKEDVIEVDPPLKEVELPSHVSLDHPEAHAGRSYLNSRGVDWRVASGVYHICYSPWDNTLVFPVEVDGMVVGWQKRVAGHITEGLKTWSSPEIPRSKVVLFAPRLTTDTAVLSEGPFDSLKCHFWGGNVAGMGKAISKGQVQFLASRGIKKLYLWLDPDAQTESVKFEKYLHLFDEIWLVPTPVGKKDPGECTVQEALQQKEKSRRLLPNRLNLCFE